MPSILCLADSQVVCRDLEKLSFLLLDFLGPTGLSDRTAAGFKKRERPGMSKKQDYSLLGPVEQHPCGKESDSEPEWIGG